MTTTPRRAARTAGRLLRRAWNWLTSMRTALVLLFLLALAAIPGALLPQRSLNEANVIDYLETNGRIAEIYDSLQLFDVFESTWFNAIFVLLMVSLIGCIIPRTRDHYRAMRTPPVRAPKRLDRMPKYAAHERPDLEPDEMLARAKAALKGWKIAEFAPAEDRDGKASIAAERGFSREFFNLLFHLGIVAMLVTIAIGRLTFYEGNVILVTDTGSADSAAEAKAINGKEFCNTAPANFDSFRAGPLFDGTGLDPFCLQAHTFEADYLPSGQADMFRSKVSFAEAEDITTDPEGWEDYDLEVNHPLRLSEATVYLQGHGFAPTFTVTWPNGEIRTQTVQFRPDDPTFFLSSGAVRFDPPAGMYGDLYERRQNQLSLQGLFAPTAEWAGENGQLLESGFPALTDPAVAIDIYRGDNGLDTGRGQSIFDLDPTLIHSGQLRKLERVNLEKGESVTLDDGTEVRFDGAQEYVNIQVSHNNSYLWVLAFAIVMIGSLTLSLFIKRRRVWLRVAPAAGGGTALEMAGIARTDQAGWGGEFDELYRGLMGLPDPDDVDEDSGIDPNEGLVR